VPMYGWFATAATRSPTGADRIGARRLADRRFEVRKYRDSAGAVSAQVVVWLRGSRVVAISCGMWHRLTVNDALKICHPRDLLRHAFYFLPVPNV
jgi:hypothetical protein